MHLFKFFIKILVDLKYDPWLEIEEWKRFYELARTKDIISLSNENSTVLFQVVTLSFLQQFLQISARNVIYNWIFQLLSSGVTRAGTGRAQVGLSPITEALSPTIQQSRSSQIPFRAPSPSRISAAEPHHRPPPSPSKFWLRRYFYRLYYGKK